MSRLLVFAIVVSSVNCLALDPSYWNCDTSPFLGRSAGEEPTCADYPNDCSFKVDRQEQLVLWGQSCDHEYPLDITNVWVEPALAEWNLDPDADPHDGMLTLTPREAGIATLTLEYAWQGGFKEFETEMLVTANDI